MGPRKKILPRVRWSCFRYLIESLIHRGDALNLAQRRQRLQLAKSK